MILTEYQNFTLIFRATEQRFIKDLIDICRDNLLQKTSRLNKP